MTNTLDVSRKVNPFSGALAISSSLKCVHAAELFVCNRLTVFKIELVKVHPFHQVPQGLGFKRGESRVTDPPEKQKKRG